MHPAGPYIIAGFLILSGVLAVLFEMKKPKLNQLYQLFKETMKKIFLIIILLMSAICSHSQETGKTHADSLAATFTSAAVLDSAHFSNKIYPVAFIYGDVTNKIIFWTSMPDRKTGKTTLHIKRSQIKWLNDSTAVISPYHKPKRRKFNGIYLTGQSYVGSKTIKK